MGTRDGEETLPDLGERFRRAIAAIDAANADDPETIVLGGERLPKELTHARLATRWVRRLRPDASEALLLAARAHHIRRWTLPRDRYPRDRRGYLRWRTTLHEVHAGEVDAILAALDYDAETRSRVGAIVRKQRLRNDPEVQTFEDALALVFLETQLDETAGKIDDDDKTVDVIRKTWTKMTPAGQQAAAALPLSARGRTLVARALEPLDGGALGT